MLAGHPAIDIFFSVNFSSLLNIASSAPVIIQVMIPKLVSNPNIAPCQKYKIAYVNKYTYIIVDLKVIFI